MKKPTQKKVKECLKDIEHNFSELIDTIIYYEKNEMDDWSTDIIGKIEKLPAVDVLNLLFKDLSCRNSDDFEIYYYKRLWWALINEESIEINNKIIEFLKGDKKANLFKNVLNDWLLEIDEGIVTKENISKLVNTKNKMK